MNCLCVCRNRELVCQEDEFWNSIGGGDKVTELVVNKIRCSESIGEEYEVKQ